MRSRFGLCSVGSEFSMFRDRIDDERRESFDEDIEIPSENG